MKITSVLLLIVVASVVQSSCWVKKEVNSPYKWKPNPTNGPLPTNWNWANVNNTNFLGTTKNQHIPQYCGSCWAQAATSSISDRIAIMRGSAFPEIDISPQVLLTCDKNDDGCHGGYPPSAFQWMNQNDITDSSCAPYQALSWYEGLVCNATALCMDCAPSGACAVPATYNKYRVGEYGDIPADATSIQNEIYARGPVVCGIDAGPIVNFTGTGVFASNQGTEINHAISVVGWGVTTDGQNTPYWVVRNSWGEYWGDLGYIKIYRGNDTLFIEDSCSYGVPINTWQNQTYPHTSKQGVVNEDSGKVKIRSLKALLQTKVIDPYTPLHHKGCVKPNPNAQQHITGPQPKDMPMALPEGFWWGDVDGVNYLSWTVNQHIPQYCGSCWAQAASSSLADRVNIESGMKFPRVALAPQVLINCKAGGDCNGGSMDGPFVFAKKTGLPDMGCQVYQALNPPQETCSPIQQCKNCKWNPDFSQNCWAVTSFPRWKVSQYGAVRGIDAMKKELFARGPMSCQMMVTNKFEKYTGGIYSERVLLPLPNHAISVVGWGKDAKSGVEYWIVRNSWGSHFGENGYFRIKMGGENLGIDEYDCWWGIPVADHTVDNVATE